MFTPPCDNLQGQGGVILLESIPGPPMVGMSDLSVAPTQAGVSCEDSAKRSGLVEEFMVVSGENKDKVNFSLVLDFSKLRNQVFTVGFALSPAGGETYGGG